MTRRTRTPPRERMAGIDAAWWHMSRPLQPMVIVGVLLLDTAPTLDALRTIVAERLLVHPRFRQRPVHDEDGDHWERAPNFRIERHVRAQRIAVPDAARTAHAADAGRQTLQRWIGTLCTLPLPSAHPLWQLVLVEGPGPPALVVRVHHCYADGAALVRLLLALTDAEHGSASALRPVPAPTAAPSSALDDLLGMLGNAQAGMALGATAEMPAAPARAPGSGLSAAAAGSTTQALRAAVAFGAELVRLADLAQESPTPLQDPAGPTKSVAWCDALPQAEVRRVAQAFGCSVHALLVSCAAAALGQHLRERGHDPRKTEIRVLVPTPLRGTRRAAALHGNHFGLVNLLLPLGMANPVARAWEVHRRLQALSGTHQALVMHLLLGVVGLLPQELRTRALDLLSDKASAVLTTVPGPPATRTLAGARIDDILFWVPQAGAMGLGISILSYAGRMRIGWMCDDARLPHVDALARAANAEFRRLVPLADQLAAPMAEPPAAPVRD